MKRRPHVMVVGDDEEIVAIISKLLQLEGYRVIHTRDGNTALALMEIENPDLVILDIGLTVMNGIHTCLYLQKHSPVPILALSTWGTKKNRFRGLNLGRHICLTRSFDVDELPNWIEQILRQNSIAPVSEPKVAVTAGV